MPYYCIDGSKLRWLSYSYNTDTRRTMQTCRKAISGNEHVDGTLALNTVTCEEGITPWMKNLRITNTGTETVAITTVDIYAAG